MSSLSFDKSKLQWSSWHVHGRHLILQRLVVVLNFEGLDNLQNRRRINQTSRVTLKSKFTLVIRVWISKSANLLPRHIRRP